MLWCYMEANDQQYMYKIVISIDWILSWLESTYHSGYRKVPQLTPPSRIYFGLLQSNMIPLMLRIDVHLPTNNTM
jgi:hypothetical protein